MAKIILVGMNNPHSRDPEHALYPAPQGVAGHRLWEMMNNVHPDFSRNEYLRTFDRVNLCKGDWSRSIGATNAATMCLKEDYPSRTVVLLGAEVLRCFAMAGVDISEKRQFTWHIPLRTAIGRWAHVPHPSGRSHAWNDPKVRAKAAGFFKDLVTMARESAQEK